MATIRQGYLDDFTLKNQKVGIGTSTANEKLEVIGGSRGGSANITGIATLTSYEGFQNTKFASTGNISVDSGESGSLSEIVIGTGTTLSVGTGATTGQGSIKSLKVSDTFTPPIGGTNERPSAPQPGALFYNKDFKTIEYWDGSFWRQVDNVTTSGRGVFGGGQTPTNVQIIDYVSIVTGGKAVNFGLMVSGVRHSTGAASNKVRGLYAGDGPGGTNVIEYITIASEGNSIDFGDLTANRRNPSGLASSTRGIFSCGSSVNTIDYVEIMTLGDALDFGDCLEASHYLASCASPTRGIIGGSRDATSAMISFITIASKGDSTRFGDVYVRRRGFAGSSNSVRGIFAGGSSETGKLKTTEFVTIASEGNAQYFGDLAVGVASVNSVASEIRSVIAGGTLDSGKSDRIESVTIATAGNAVDFGDLTLARGHSAGLSDSHGGLGGF